MMKLTTKHFTRNSNQFNKMPAWPYRELLENDQEKTLPRIKHIIPPTLTMVQELCLFYKIFKGSKLVYLFNLISTKNLTYKTRNTDKFTLFPTKQILILIQKLFFSIHCD